MNKFNGESLNIVNENDDNITIEVIEAIAEFIKEQIVSVW